MVKLKTVSIVKVFQGKRMKSILQMNPRRGILIGSAFMMSICCIPIANAQNGDAEKLLKGMADYVAGQKALTVTYDSDVEVITSTLQKIQFTSSGQVQLSRPDKLRVRRTGGYRDVEIVFDGKMLTVNNKDDKGYAQIETTGTTEELIDVLREKHGVVAPGADLLLTNVFNVMMADVVDAAVSARASSTALNAIIWRFATSTPTGRSGSKRARSRSRENTSSPARVSRKRRNTRYGSRTGRRRLQPMPLHSSRPLPQEDYARRTRQHRRSTSWRRYGRSKEMTRKSAALVRLSIGTALGAAVLSWNGQLPVDPQASLVSAAEARIGRPLTPMSYAGVARRTTRRAVAVGAVALGTALSWLRPWWPRPLVRRSWTSTGESPPFAGKLAVAVLIAALSALLGGSSNRQ